MTRGAPRTQRTSSRETVVYARDLRRDQTPAEQALWQLLRNRGIDGHKFRRQHPIGPFIADFFCAEAALVIEVDGPIHDRAEQRQRDALRNAALGDHGLRLLRLRNNEVLTDPESAVRRIRDALGA
jgi:very-short-patch-repair endonuclease